LEKAIQKAEELIEISTHQLPDLEKLKEILSELNQILYLVLEIAHLGDRDEEAPESLVKDIRTDAQKEAKGSRQPGKSELQTATPQLKRVQEEFLADKTVYNLLKVSVYTLRAIRADIIAPYVQVAINYPEVLGENIEKIRASIEIIRIYCEILLPYFKPAEAPMMEQTG